MFIRGLKRGKQSCKSHLPSCALAKTIFFKQFACEQCGKWFFSKSIMHHVLYPNMFAAMFVNLKRWIPIRSNILNKDATKKTHSRGMGKPFFKGLWIVL
jgi:hypothetical protein